MTRKKHRCFSLQVDGAEVRVHGDPAMDPRAREALRQVAASAADYLRSIEVSVAPEAVKLTDAQIEALLRIAGTGSAYPLRRTKLGTWVALCNAGLVRCVNHDRFVAPGTLLEITRQGIVRADVEREKKNARKRG